MKLNQQKDKKKHLFRKVLLGILAVFFVLGIASFIYIKDYYHADYAAIDEYRVKTGYKIPTETLDNGYKVYAPEGATTGLIFYPGGKVEYTSYEPLMETCASYGILCILVEMPGNLAVFDRNAADGLQEQYPKITSWYIGGHSLGGAMAASYVADNSDTFNGLVLLGAYSTKDLTDTDLHVLSMYGSEDLVLNRKKYEKYKTNLPTDYQEVIIEGGCHAGFGMYGVQKGDGTSTITNEEQITQTAQQILNMIEMNSNE